jgi:hypothetical protein
VIDDAEVTQWDRSKNVLIEHDGIPIEWTLHDLDSSDIEICLVSNLYCQSNGFRPGAGITTISGFELSIGHVLFMIAH